MAGEKWSKQIGHIGSKVDRPFHVFIQRLSWFRGFDSFNLFEKTCDVSNGILELPIVSF